MAYLLFVLVLAGLVYVGWRLTRATEGIAAVDERRRQDREQLQARLRGDEPPKK